MFKIVEKFTGNDGSIVAWKVDEDGFKYNIGCRATYHELFFQSMRESGYVYHDYDNNITDPTGMNIKDVVESSDYLSQSALIDLYDSLDVGMLDERNIVQYFKRDVKIELVDVKEPIQLTIKTREEFLERINSINKANVENIKYFSPYPINAFTAKEALFTLEEIASNKNDARVKFIEMFNNNIMYSIKNIKDLCKAYGTSSDNIDVVKILTSYLAWGVPGINADIVNVSVNVDPSSPVDDPRSGVFATSLKYGVKDNYGTLYSEDVSNVNVMDLVGGTSVDTTAMFGSSSVDSVRQDPVGDKFKVVAYGYRDVNPQVKITLLSKDGITAYFYADCNCAKLFQGDRSITNLLPMFSYKTIDNVVIPFSRIAKCGVDYISNSVLVRSFIKKEVAKATTEAPYKNSFELMSKNGVSPYYAPMFINRRIRDGDSTLVEINDVVNFTGLHFLCSKTVRAGLSSSIINKYGPGEDDFEEKSLEEQMEYINEEIEELSANGNYLVEPMLPEGSLKMADPAYTAWREEFEANEIPNVNFVLACMNGTQSIGNFANGMKVDASSNFYKIFGIVMGLYTSQKSYDDTLTLAQFLNSEIENVVDLSRVFKKRNSAYRGAIKDLATYRSTMSIQSKKLVYVTKIFRENGNSTIEESNRHYGFEAYVIDKSNGSQGSAIYKSLLEQVMDDFYRKGMGDQIIYAGEITTKILFSIVFADKMHDEVDGIHTITHSSKIEGIQYTVDTKLSRKYYEMLRNGSLVSVKYSSCYDFCNLQFSEADMTCVYYCVNANIGPWNIVPRASFSIKDYNIFINYYSIKDLEMVLPESIVSRIKTGDGKVIDCLRDSFSENNLFSNMDSYMSIKEHMELSRSNAFLDESEYEDLDAYMIRTTNEITTARNDGNTVVNTVLKSDIQFEAFKPYATDCDYVGTEPTGAEEFSKVASNRYISVMSPRVLGRDWTDRIAIESPKEFELNKAKFSRISFDRIPFDVKIWNKKLLVADFDSSVVTYISKGKIYVGTDSCNLSDVTEDFMIDLVERGLAIQMSAHKYIIKTVVGFVEVEV